MQTITVQLTREQLEQKRLEAAQSGFALTGDSGKLSAKGVDLEYSYDQTVLTVNILRVSFADKVGGYSEERVAQMLKDLLKV